MRECTHHAGGDDPIGEVASPARHRQPRPQRRLVRRLALPGYHGVRFALVSLQDTLVHLGVEAHPRLQRLVLLLRRALLHVRHLSSLRVAVGLVRVAPALRFLRVPQRETGPLVGRGRDLAQGVAPAAAPANALPLADHGQRADVPEMVLLRGQAGDVARRLLGLQDAQVVRRHPRREVEVQRGVREHECLRQRKHELRFQELDHHVRRNVSTAVHRSPGVRRLIDMRAKQCTYAESPAIITLSLWPDMPMALPPDSTNNRYTSKHSSMANG